MRLYQTNVDNTSFRIYMKKSSKCDKLKNENDKGIKMEEIINKIYNFNVYININSKFWEITSGEVENRTQKQLK